MSVHLTCFGLKNLFCGCYRGGFGGNPCCQIFNLSLFSCFSISTSNITSSPRRYRRRQAPLHCAPANMRPSIEFLKHLSCCNFFLSILVPASGRHSLSFSLLIKLLHTPSTLILAHSYFCLRDSLNSVLSLQKLPCPPNLSRRTGLWSR